MFFHFCKLSIKFTPNPTQRTSHTHARTHKYKHQIYIRNIMDCLSFDTWHLKYVTVSEMSLLINWIVHILTPKQHTHMHARLCVIPKSNFLFELMWKTTRVLHSRQLQWVTSRKSKTKSHEMKKFIFQNFDIRIHTKLIERTHFSITHRINKTKQHIILYKRIVVENFK